jgi:hypothetical protein
VVPELRARGVTDFRIGMRVPPDRADAEQFLARVVTAFRAGTGRS